MIIELIKGVAFLLALCFLQSFVARRWRHNEIIGQLLSGVLFGGICVVGMAAPLLLQPGIIIDPRSAILSMAGLFGGPVVGFVAAVMAAAFRIWLGGAGTWIGVAVIVTSVVLGLIYRAGRDRYRLPMGVVPYLVFGFVVHVAAIAWFLLFPPEVVERVFSLIAIPFVVTFTLGTAILGFLLQDMERRTAIENALAESEERFAKAFRASPAPMSISNLETGLTLDVNDEWLAMLGYSREEAIGKTSAELGAWTDETRRSDFVNRLKNDGSLRDFEATVVTKSGEKRRVILAGETIDNERMLLVFHDITERLAMQRQLAHAQRMEAVGQLTGGLAHDLNNVLAIISGNVEFIKLRGGADPQLEKPADAALQGVRRAGDLTRKLLDFSRTDAGITQRVSVDAFIHGMENLIAKSLTPAINLEMELSEDGWAVDIDPGDLEAALVNLALNARDAMPNGGTLLIETANKVIDDEYEARNLGSSAGEFVMISVTDTGTGMAPETVEKAFEPFFTTKEVGKGTGLGLSMVYAFVQRSGGHVKIYSEPGKGTMVRLYLPRATGTEKKRGQGSSAKTPLFLGNNETILVVDDEPQLVDAAVSILRSLGYQTRTASDATESLNILRQDPSIDLVFSDVIMPGPLDGYHLAAEAQRIRPGIKVLLTSGFTRKREEFLNGKGEATAELASNLLHKPYSMDELATAIRQVLDRAP